MHCQSSKHPKLDNSLLSKAIRIWNWKFFSNSRVFLRNRTKRFSAQLGAHINTQRCWELLGDTDLRPLFMWWKVLVNYREWQQQLKKIAPHLKCTLARAPINDQPFPNMVVKPSSFLMLVQQDEKPLEESMSLNGTYFVTFFGNKSMRKIRLQPQPASENNSVDLV